MIRAVFLLLFSLPNFSYSQKSECNYIEYYKYANEANYFFYEMYYDSAVNYFEFAFKLVPEAKPQHHYNYCRALWEIGEKTKASSELKKSSISLFDRDSTFFIAMNPDLKQEISSSIKENISALPEYPPHYHFIDSIEKLDQSLRQLLSDSIIPYYSLNEGDTLVAYYWKLITEADRTVGKMLVEYTKENGFPAGVNALWYNMAATSLLHMDNSWYVENYQLLFSEVKKGNLEPWMLARGIDRMFATDSCITVSPYDFYHRNGSIDPFLMFKNRVEIGLSPYYNEDWSLYSRWRKPFPTLHYEVYRSNKKIYNCSKW